jgi:hypothetical protein
MPKSDLFLLVASTFVLSSTALADGGLTGLEMDVMDAHESPAQATARIALPGAGAIVDDGRPDTGDLVTGQARGGGYGGEAAALDNAVPAGPASPAESVGTAGPETSDSLDLSAPDVSDGGGDVGGVGAEPIDPGVVDGGVVDGGPGTIGIIEPGDGSTDGTPIDESPPVDEPPVDEIPIGELPGGGTVIDEPPTDDTPGDDVVDGDPSGGGVTIMPAPGEAPGGVEPAVESGGPLSGDHR